MGIINMEDIREGMTLADDIKDRNGRVILAGGNKISEKHLRVFRMWGVTEADISGIEKEELAANVVAQLDPLLFQEVEHQVHERFCHVNMEHPFMKELFHLVTLRLVRRRSRGQRDD